MPETANADGASSGGRRERENVEAQAIEAPAGAEWALRGFLAAFANLDWDVFCSYFDDEATVFFPRGDRPARVAGRDQIEHVFLLECGETRSSAARPPYLDLRPHDLLMQEMGELALASFHLNLPGALRRRAGVLRKRDGAWRILHLHASNMSSAWGE